MKSKFRKIVIFLILVFLLHEVIIITDGLIDENSDAKVAVILGSKVNTDGSLSGRLKARLDKGLELYQDSVVSELYMSGGLGKEGFYEGTVMADYLISKGVPKNSIKIDNNGINTRNSALNFRRDYPAESKVIVVSQYFHITRTKLAFRQVGVKDVYGIHCEFFELRDPYSAFREFFGLYKYLVLY